MRKVYKNKGILLVTREMRVCGRPGCDNTFECKVTSDKKYCCGGHAPHKQVDQEVRTCACGKTFEVRITSTQKYCNRSCATHYTGLGKYPSKETRAKIGLSNSIAQKGKDKPWLRVAKEIRTCTAPGCNNTFECSVNSRRKFCCSGHAPIGRVVSEETVTKLRKTSQHYWDTIPLEIAEVRIAKAMKASREATGRRPNKFECVCMDKLDKIYPDKFKYTGDGSFLVSRHSADAYSEELNIVALFDGIYWHLECNGLENTIENKKLRELIESKPFLDAGHNVIFIWEDKPDIIVKQAC